MRAIDYISIFLMLASAPTWQGALDHLSPGLGSCLVLILLIASIQTVRRETEDPRRRRASRYRLLNCRGCMKSCRG